MNDHLKNLFIIRKVGMKKSIVEDITSQIRDEGCDIIDVMLITINNKKKFYKKLYNNFNEFEKEILQSNDNECLVIITDAPEGFSATSLKWKIRKQYANLFPHTKGTAGNIIHASDASDIEKELRLLFDKDKLNFHNIGHSSAAFLDK